MSSLPVIPSLTALRAFEAAIRRGSFRDAAEELSVTPAAVSHQIQHLEAMLGTKLFLRKHRAIAPTEAALRCLPKIQEGFESIREALDRAVHDYPNVLTIGAPTVADVAVVDAEIASLRREISRFYFAHNGKDSSATATQ